jgi:hypothetical protein
MPILRVLKPNEQKRYEHPPIFDDTTRKIYLSFADNVKEPIKQGQHLIKYFSCYYMATLELVADSILQIDFMKKTFAMFVTS